MRALNIFRIITCSLKQVLTLTDGETEKNDGNIKNNESQDLNSFGITNKNTGGLSKKSSLLEDIISPEADEADSKNYCCRPPMGGCRPMMGGCRPPMGGCGPAQNAQHHFNNQLRNRFHQFASFYDRA